jgi:hypothetical protein
MAADGATVQTVVTSPPYYSQRPSLGATTITQESAKQKEQRRTMKETWGGACVRLYGMRYA